MRSIRSPQGRETCTQIKIGVQFDHIFPIQICEKARKGVNLSRHISTTDWSWETNEPFKVGATGPTFCQHVGQHVGPFCVDVANISPRYLDMTLDLVKLKTIYIQCLRFDIIQFGQRVGAVCARLYGNTKTRATTKPRIFILWGWTPLP